MSGIMKSVAMLLALGLVACGGSKSKDSGSTGKVSAIDAMGITPPDSPWEQMSVADREFYMIGKVNPIMQELFAAHDAEEFGDFDCVDCHGEEMREFPTWKQPRWIPFYRVGPYKLWGLTYRILRPLVPRLLAGEWPV